MLVPQLKRPKNAWELVMKSHPLGLNDPEI